MKTRTVEIDISLSDFSDGEIRDEAVWRGMMWESAPAPGETIEDVLRDAQAYLLARRVAKGERRLRDALERFVPAELFEALDAVQAGRTADAICLLDRFCEPAPARTATSLPKRKPAREVTE